MKSTIIAPRRAVRRQPRPFGEGLFAEDATPTVRTTFFGPAADRLATAMTTVCGPAPAPRVDPWDVEGPPESWPTSTDAELWTAADIPLEPLADPDGIPANVTRIAVIRGDERLEYRRGTDGERWLRVSDGSPIWATSADRAYREGKVAILADAPQITRPEPARPATARPEPFIPTFADCVEVLGFELGRQGIDAAPCKTWLPAIKDRFAFGLDRGTAARRELEAEEARRQDWEDTQEADALGLNRESHERAEAGLMPLPSVEMD
jgi:hypothetical protein